MKLSDCFSKFIHYQVLKNNSPSTIEDYSVIINRFIIYCNDIDSSELTADDINDYGIYLRSLVKPVSVRTYIRHIRVFIHFCIDKGYCNDFYKDIVVPKQPKNVINILTASDIRKLLDCLSSDDYYSVRNKSMIILMLDCGLRASEVVHLELDCINFESCFVKVLGKGNKERIVPFGSAVLSSFNNYLCIRPASESKFLYLSEDGSELSRRVFKKMFKKLRSATGIKNLYPHLLRHTFATNFLLYSQGDVYKLKMLLGHSDIATTQIYLHYANYYSFLKHKDTYSFLDDMNSRPLDF